MAKTYILEPTEATVIDVGRGEYSLTYRDCYDDLVANKDKPLFTTVDGDSAPITVKDGENPRFSTTVNGWEFSSFGDGNSVFYPVSEDAVIVPDSTHTISIYIETEDSDDSDDSDGFKPITREEMYLAAIAGIYELPSGMTPITRKEILYQKILDKGSSDSGGELSK